MSVDNSDFLDPDGFSSTIRSDDEPETCGKHSCIGTRCVKPANHDGPHRGAHSPVEWTDESDRAYGNQIAKSMEGRRD